jgi:signal transduction histidine kinase
MAARKLFVVLAIFGLSAWTQTVPHLSPQESSDPPPLTPIEQATTRSGADFLPALEGKVVRIAGQVTEKAFWNLDAFLLPVRDEDEDFGILIQGAAGVNVRAYEPGVVVEATGQIVRRAGMPVLLATRLVETGMSEATGSRHMALSDAVGFRNLALPVEVEGRIVGLGDDGASEWLSLTDGRTTVRIVRHKERRDDEPRLARFREGDRVRASGIVTQNAVLPPFDRFFQVTMVAPDRITLLETAAMIPGLMLLTAFSFIAALAGIWWVREQRKQGLRQIVEPMHAVGEEVLAASSLAEMLKKIQLAVPDAARVSGVAVYLFDRKGRKLDRAGGFNAPASVAALRGNESVSLDNPANPLQAAVGACFRNKAAVNIPDTRRAYSDERGALGFRSGDPVADMPRSILALPMLAQDESAGVMLLYRSEGVRYFHHEEQASAKHLANQVAAAMKLLEQRSVREQLFKSEKLAATGQLIAGVVNDLRSPVEAVLTMSQLLLFRGQAGGRELEMLAADAQRIAEIVTRLISFSRKEDAVAKPVDLNSLVAGLAEFRGREWKSASIRFEDRTSRDPALVMGAQGQLEQVLLNVLLYAERSIAELASAAAHAEKGAEPKPFEGVISIATSLLGQRVLLAVDFPVEGETPDPFEADPDEGSESGLALLRGIVQSHGGEIRFDHLQPGSRAVARSATAAARIEIELPRAQLQQQQQQQPAASDPKDEKAETPVSGAAMHPGSRSGEHRAAAALAAAAARAAAASSLRMTAVLLEPEPANQRKFVTWMSHRGHRVIPVRSAEEAYDLVHRVKCDLVACTSRMPGFHWHGFYDKVRGNTDAFIVLLDANSVGHSFAPGEGYVLRKPLQESDFNQVLDAVTEQLSPPYAQAG